MWQFISHHVMRPPLWTWTRAGRDGAVEARSSGTFASYEEAWRDALRHGLDPKADRYEKVVASGEHSA